FCMLRGLCRVTLLDYLVGCPVVLRLHDLLLSVVDVLRHKVTLELATRHRTGDRMLMVLRDQMPAYATILPWSTRRITERTPE
ncbi:MAG TPA: hypothetical protein VGP74_00265, partial [Rubrobacteraceae bacterium]|nr:hypothetical protein [Rubrobacteraceae bacterium]